MKHELNRYDSLSPSDDVLERSGSTGESPTGLHDGSAVLITGGAGFIGSRVARALARSGTCARVIALDNLRRQGSELNIPKLRRAGVTFVHGDVRLADDLEPLQRDVKLIIDCAADPSVLAGYAGAPGGVVGSNLTGTVNCLELARRTGADVVFLSTSRVYPIAALNRIAIVERESRFDIDVSQSVRGVSAAGVSESFPLEGSRSLYGATKLASELLLQEYASMYGFRFVINRLGVVTGPGQMGRVEQGVFSLWMARHHFGGELTYRGWGGTGKQVRDLLHVDDVCRLVERQLVCWEQINGRIYNVGGGAGNAISLREATALCQDLTGRTIPVNSDPNTHPADVKLYYTDCTNITNDTGWTPVRDTRRIFADLLEWLRAEGPAVEFVFAGGPFPSGR